MPTPGHNPLPRPDEADLLAWVEGERLAPERERAVAAAMEADPALARQLRLMRSDREALESLPQLAAPPGLMESVEAALQPVLERRMLLELRAGEPTEIEPPVSLVQPVRRSIFQAFVADRVGRRLAAAAAILLLVGGASYFATSYFSGPSKPKALPSLARGDGPKTPERPLAKSDTEPKAAASETSAALAKANAGAAPLTEESAAPAQGELAALVGPPAPAEAYQPDASDTAHAVALAAQGRLVIHVTSGDNNSPQADRIAERIRRTGSPAYRLGGELPAPVLAILNPPRAVPQPHEVPRPAYAAGTDLPPGAYGPPAPASVEFTPQAPVPSAFMIQSRLEAAALDALASTLTAANLRISFEESAEPLPLDEVPTLNPSAVLWWTQPPAGWTRWAAIPVVVDPR